MFSSASILFLVGKAKTYKCEYYCQDMNERLGLALWVIFIVYTTAKILKMRTKKIKYDRLDEVVNSNKYKVKGQYD